MGRGVVAENSNVCRCRDSDEIGRLVRNVIAPDALFERFRREREETRVDRLTASAARLTTPELHDLAARIAALIEDRELAPAWRYIWKSHWPHSPGAPEISNLVLWICGWIITAFSFEPCAIAERHGASSGWKPSPVARRRLFLYVVAIVEAYPI
jgi:hypothetical protein